jgi:hypothetical protein
MHLTPNQAQNLLRTRQSTSQELYTSPVLTALLCSLSSVALLKRRIWPFTTYMMTALAPHPNRRPISCFRIRYSRRQTPRRIILDLEKNASPQNRGTAPACRPTLWRCPGTYPMAAIIVCACSRRRQRINIRAAAGCSSESDFDSGEESEESKE